jgi:hypothetical protein
VRLSILKLAVRLSNERASGSIAIQLPTGNPLFGEVLFPVYIGVFVWGGIYLRDDRLRTLIPLRS